MTPTPVVDGESEGGEVPVHGAYGGDIFVVLVCRAGEAGFD